ncbi:STAS domain-containing protein [Paenibacillus sp. TAB 01]|uniref:STAS domain-containing protein n=1 Tax=Paenibacillus sp. TAB 01 TaxID=3368988 RepID=UPI0037517667
MESLAVRVVPSDIALVVELKGDLLQQSESALMKLRSWRHGLGGGKRALVICADGVRHMSAAGLTVLIRMAQAGEEGDYQTFVCGLIPAYRRLFEVMGLTRFVMLYPDTHVVMQRLLMSSGPAAGQASLSS